eukprot:3288797-Rhodomonas_salina.1
MHSCTTVKAKTAKLLAMRDELAEQLRQHEAKSSPPPPDPAPVYSLCAQKHGIMAAFRLELGPSRCLAMFCGTCLAPFVEATPEQCVE